MPVPLLITWKKTPTVTDPGPRTWPGLRRDLNAFSVSSYWTAVVSSGCRAPHRVRLRGGFGVEALGWVVTLAPARSILWENNAATFTSVKRVTKTPSFLFTGSSL